MEKADYSIFIVEDELIIAEVLKEMLEELGYTVIGIAKNYEKAMQFLQSSEKIDLAFLDINLGGEKNGMDVGEEIKNSYQFPIVYLTSYSDLETITAAGKTNPAAYLIKPFKKEDILATVEIIRARPISTSKTIMIKDGYNILKIEALDILYFKAEGNYVEVYTAERKHLIRYKLEDFIQEAGEEHFIQTHRSYVVNINKVEAINGHEVFINTHKVPISRTFKEQVISRFKS